MTRNLGKRTLDYTESLCPICLKVVDAQVTERDGAVYMRKECPDHGPMIVYLWPDVEHYNWIRSFRFPKKPPKTEIALTKGCPFDCGLCSEHLRCATLAEIEVTLHCNLRCPVCFMSAGDSEPDPSMETLESMYTTILQQAGPQTSIQLTGGEPTVRKDLLDIIRLGREVGFPAIEVNTNGIVLARHPEYAQQLRDAGATGVYMQFDGLSRDVYEKIRGEDLLAAKLQAIENCRVAGLQVVLAMTIISGINHEHIGQVLNFALDNLDVVVGLALQPAFTSGRFDIREEKSLTMGDVLFMLEDQSNGMINAYDLWPLGCSHPLCSCATHLIKDGDKVIPFTRLISREECLALYEPNSPQGSIFADIIAKRDGEISRGLSLVVMNYMDAMTVELERLKECSMLETMEDGRLIPFCAYQLTNLSGERIYTPWGRDGIRRSEVRKYA